MPTGGTRQRRSSRLRAGGDLALGVLPRGEMARARLPIHPCLTPAGCGEQGIVARASFQAVQHLSSVQNTRRFQFGANKCGEHRKTPFPSWALQPSHGSTCTRPGCSLAQWEHQDPGYRFPLLFLLLSCDNEIPAPAHRSASSPCC